MGGSSTSQIAVRSMLVVGLLFPYLTSGSLQLVRDLVHAVDHMVLEASEPGSGEHAHRHPHEHTHHAHHGLTDLLIVLAPDAGSGEEVEPEDARFRLVLDQHVPRRLALEPVVLPWISCCNRATPTRCPEPFRPPLPPPPKV